MGYYPTWLMPNHPGGRVSFPPRHSRSKWHLYTSFSKIVYNEYMKATLKQPTNLFEAVQFFADESRAFDTMVARRWPEGVKCPNCGSTSIRFMEARRFWNCNGCRKQFSVKTGTIFEASPISLGKWLTGMWLVVNAKNGISSCEIARSLGITQKSAWFMAHRIRLALENGTFEKLGGHVEADETYVGGKAVNMHPIEFWK